jgi:hypothetical protein
MEIIGRRNKILLIYSIIPGPILHKKRMLTNRLIAKNVKEYK